MAAALQSALGGAVGQVTSALAPVESSVSQAVAGALFTAQIAGPFAIYTVSAEVNGILTQIPVVGTTLAGAEATAISILTVQLAPGTSVLETVIGSVTALVGTATKVIPIVVASATGEVGSLLSQVAGKTSVVTAIPAPTATAVVGSLTSAAGGIVGSATSAAGGALSTITGAGGAVSTVLMQGGAAASSLASGLPLFTNMAMAVNVPNTQLMSFMTLIVAFVSMMLGSGFMFMMM